MIWWCVAVSFGGRLVVAAEEEKAVVGDRKYRQRGYMESYEEERREKREKPAGLGPRQRPVPETRQVARCAQCGVVLPVMAGPLGQCPQCGLELHSCKQCAHFDPASRFECSQPITERIAQKEARNDCQYFALRTVVEREVSPGGVRPEDARRAFESLFKK